jgi:hypothetical protein
VEQNVRESFNLISDSGSDAGTWIMNQRGGGATQFNFGDVTSSNVYTSYLQINSSVANFAMGIGLPNTITGFGGTVLSDYVNNSTNFFSVGGPITTVSSPYSLVRIGNTVTISCSGSAVTSWGGNGTTGFLEFGISSTPMPVWAQPAEPVRMFGIVMDYNGATATSNWVLIWNAGSANAGQIWTGPENSGGGYPAISGAVVCYPFSVTWVVSTTY